jgi:AcrR family transcriptional regulator
VKLLDAVAKSSPEETRTRILSAAREVFAEKGSRGTTTREVADRAGVNEATLFRHFGTKVALIQTMLDHYSAPPEGFQTFIGNLAGSLDEQMRAMGRVALENIRKKQDLIRVSMAEESSNPDGCTLAWRGPTSAQSVLADYMRVRVEAGELRGEPGRLARLFMSLFFAYVMCPKIWRGEGLGDQAAVDALVDIFLNGARAR